MQRQPLKDLSLSRVTFDWGVPVPGHHRDAGGSPDEHNHVMYVWFDALSNYLSAGCGYNASYVGGGGSASGGKWWPAAAHIIGKDISWFHCVIWPIMLMSAKLPLPTCVFAHGFVTDGAGEKMSKSIGNVILSLIHI